MNILEKLFGTIRRKKTACQPVEVKQIQACMNFMDTILQKDAYVSRRMYHSQLESFQETMQFFHVLLESGMLHQYCHKNRLDFDRTTAALQQYEHFMEAVDQHNEQYIQDTMDREKEYLDTILKDIDPAIMLDEDQRKVVLCQEDYCLVIAGAGAGKTTTVAAKVKYLVEKMDIDPKQILVVSFTNKAVGELRERINRDLNIACPIATFHSVGNAVLHKNSPEEKRNIVDDGKLYRVIQNYLCSTILKNESAVKRLILFFASYFDAPYEGEDLNAFFRNASSMNYATMRSELEDFRREIVDARSKKKVTIQNEVMRSLQEVQIANFLYLSGIDYEYEVIYPYDISGSVKPYTPDFLIRQGNHIAWLEHFGIHEDGTNSLYSPSQLQAYKKAVFDKVSLHRQHHTDLLYTFSGYKDGRSLTEHLKEILERNGFELKPRSDQEIMKKLVQGEENRYIRRLVALLCRFISNFKVNGYEADDFSRMYHSTTNVRSRLFLEIAQDCYLEYQKVLKENNAVDFQDMINDSVRVLREVAQMKQKLDFRYIIVDEYQDISRQRFDLTKALADVCDAKIIAVGDDWQSIYAFSGSDISLFTQFEKTVGYAKMLKIERTYRNAQEVIDIAGNFIQKNPSQIRKTLISPKNITDPIIIYTYDATYKKRGADGKNGANYALACAVETALDQIVAYAKEEKHPIGTVAFLGRFNFDGYNLQRSGLFEYIPKGNRIQSRKYPSIRITFLSAHASKGLGYDNVIIVNGKNETYGFPSQIQDDPVLSFVTRHDHSMDDAEERRLFYVAMTRTKNRVYFVAPMQNPSTFLIELRKDYKNVVLKGQWNENKVDRYPYKPCPLCGFPMQYRYKKSYGLRLFLCTNEPELCGFMTNEYRAGRMPILRCDACKDGYLIVRKAGNNDYFLGCTNYKKDGTGCNRTLTRQQSLILEEDRTHPPAGVLNSSESFSRK